MKEGLVELYRNTQGVVYQGEQDGKLWIESQGHLNSFSVHCFFALKKKIAGIDIAGLVNDPETASDYVIVNPCGCEKIYVLRLLELIKFKSLLEGAAVMIELNGIIYQRLHNVLV